MAKIEVDPKEIVDFLWEKLELEDTKNAIGALKGIDWNPFNDDDDEYETPWQEIGHNWDLIWDAAVSISHTVGNLLIGGVELTDPQKHKVVVSALDRAIRLPFYLEPFDGKVIDILVKASVKFLHKSGPKVATGDEKIEYKEIG